MNGNFPIPPQLLFAQIAEQMNQNFQTPQEMEILRHLDPQIIHTREQLNTLQNLINNVESLTKVVNRSEKEEDGPAVLVSEENSNASAAAIVMHASNRIISILQDDSRWKANPSGKSPRSKKASEIEEETQAMANRQTIIERIDQHENQRKVEKAKVKALCKKIDDGSIPILRPE